MRNGPSRPGTMTSAAGSKSVSISRQAPQGGTTAIVRAALLRLRMAHGDGALDRAVAVQDGTAQRHRLRADREPADRGAQVHAPSRSGHRATARLRRRCANAAGNASAAPPAPPRSAPDRRRRLAASPGSLGGFGFLASSGAAIIAFSTTTAWSRTRFSIVLATSGWSLRKFFAFSRPCPIRWLSKREPGAGLLDHPGLDAQVDQLATLADALAVHDVELDLPERRRQLVLHHLHPGLVADDLVAVLDLRRCGGFPCGWRHRTSARCRRWWSPGCRTSRRSSTGSG